MIKAYLSKLIHSIENLNTDEVEKFINLLIEAREHGRQIFIFGNGGSASTASHFACDMNKGASYMQEKRFKVISLTDNLSTIMAYSNDVSYESIFVEQLKNFINAGDLVIGISGSGNSENVLKAIEYANQNNAKTIGITGYLGGKLKDLASISINANVEDMQISEDIHMIVCHLTLRGIVSKLGLNMAGC